MSSKRKITVSSSKRSRSTERDLREDYQPSKPRLSVFSRLGTKRSPVSSAGSSQSNASLTTPNKPRSANSDLCRNILEAGNCKFETKCKYAHTHKLALAFRDDTHHRSKFPGKRSHLHSSPNVENDWQNWNEEALECEDERMLEKRRQMLQRELAKEHESEDPKKPATNQSLVPTSKPSHVEVSSPRRSASSSSSSSTSSSDSCSSSSSSASSDEAEKPPPGKKAKLTALKRSRESSSSSNDEPTTSGKSSKRKEKAPKKKITPVKLKSTVSKRDSKKISKGRKPIDKKKTASPTKRKAGEKRKASPSRVASEKSNPEAKQPVVRKGCEVDKFGFYHAQPSQSTSSSHEIRKLRRKDGRKRLLKAGGRHGEYRRSKRSTSSDRRPLTPTQPHKRTRRASGGSPPRKRRTPPPVQSSSSKHKPSYTAATSRSGSLGKGGDRDLRASRSGHWKGKRRASSSPSTRQRGSSKKSKGGHGQRRAQLTGANAVSIDDRKGSSENRGPATPVDRGLRRNRSKSGERLLPPQALPQKTVPPQAAERSSTKQSSRERSLPLNKSPSQPVTAPAEKDSSKDEHLNAAEEFSDFGESDDEILNQEEAAKANVEEETSEKLDIEKESDCDDEAALEEIDHDDSDVKAKESDLLEGISEEELDISDDEKDDKVKVADALGVDWSQLITPMAVKEDREPGAFRKRWTPGAILSRVGLPMSMLDHSFCQETLRKLEEKGDKVEILHPVALVHAYKRRQLLDDEEPVKNEGFKLSKLLNLDLDVY